MIRIDESKQLNIHSLLYHNIPENHILKTINSVLTFEFINDLLAGSYCKNFGRPAKEPAMMTKILLLQRMYDLSDEAVIDNLKVNLAYMWFIGINPGDDLPHSSLLSKFRTMRLKDVTLDEILTETVRQCIEKGIITAESGAAIDAMHIHANTKKKVPERIMKHLARKIFKAMEDEGYEIPDYTQIEDHKEAKRVMKDYLEEVIENADERAQDEVELAQYVLDSPLFMEQKGIRSLSDMDARVGYKTKTESFFGYKMEYIMTTDGIITAVGVHDGAYVDGTDFDRLYELTKKSGIDVDAISGDKAYFKQAILEKLKEAGAQAYIPVSHSAYRINEEIFSYNKDSDQWFCVRGNNTVSKKARISNRSDKGEYTNYEYTFNKEGCVGCPLREECIKKAKGKAKKLVVGEYAAEYYAHSQWANTAEFISEYKKRTVIEGKNGELKCHHGLDRANGYGTDSVSTQAKLTAIAVNLKKVANLIIASKSKPDITGKGITAPKGAEMGEKSLNDSSVYISFSVIFTLFAAVFAFSAKISHWRD
jgi:transposase